MNSTQCRLCLADIPHDYDHSLELSREKRDSREHDEACRGLDIKELQRLQSLQQTWPDSNALVGVTFLLMIGNGAALLAPLILLDIQNSCINCWGTCLTVGIHLSTLIPFGANVLMAIFATRKFNSKWIALYSVGWAGMWLIVAICDISRAALVKKIGADGVG